MTETASQEDPIITSDYRLAPSGEGPLAYVWDDKPHRLVYDLCGEVDALRAEILSLSQERDRLREALAPFAKDGDRFPYDSILVTSFGDPTTVTTGDLRRARAAHKEPPCQET